MPKLMWFNQPTNHSGTVNFLYLTPDGDVGQFGIYCSDGFGYYLMGGPSLFKDWGQPTEAGLRLLEFLGPVFHFFPRSREQQIRSAVEQCHRAVRESRYDCHIDKDCRICAYSLRYKPQECVELLTSGQQPEAAVVFVDEENEGELALAQELARIYFQLPKATREEHGLKHDWRAHWDFG